MSQQLISLDGGVQEVVLGGNSTTTKVLSSQYISANNLEVRPTEWVPDGRPIYRRLPAVSERYQIDFFNVVSAPNTAGRAEVQDIGYIFVPWEQNSEGPSSVKVTASESSRDLLIRGGKIVWKYGGTEVFPAIVNLETLQIARGRYFLAYELIFDDSVEQNIYGVNDFSLTGQPLNITSSTDDIIGWRYQAKNAFLNSSSSFWSSRDTLFPSYAQPSTSYLQWQSELPAAYSKIVLRCPQNTAYTATAQLSYITDSGVSLVQGSVSPSLDSSGQFYQFSIPSPAFNKGWKIEWSGLDVAIESILVSGSLTLESKPAAPSTRASLVMYPSDTQPNAQTFCPLAYVEVDNNYVVTGVEDIRYIIRRDYVPVSDWLTKFYDDNLIKLFEQVKEYPLFWMDPPSCMKQEYANLILKNITVI